MGKEGCAFIEKDGGIHMVVTIYEHPSNYFVLGTQRKILDKVFHYKKKQ